MSLKVYEVKDIVELLKTSAPTVRKYISLGQLKARKVGTKWIITEDALKEFLENKN